MTNSRGVNNGACAPSSAMTGAQVRMNCPSDAQESLWHCSKMAIASEFRISALRKWGQKVMHGFHARSRVQVSPGDVGPVSSAAHTTWITNHRANADQYRAGELKFTACSKSDTPANSAFDAVAAPVENPTTVLSKWKSDKAGKCAQEHLSHVPTLLSSSQGQPQNHRISPEERTSPDAPCLFTTAGNMLETSKKRKLGNHGGTSAAQTAQQARPAWKKRLGCASSRAGFVPPCRSNEAQDRCCGTQPERSHSAAGGENGIASKKDGRSTHDVSGDDQSVYGERTRSLLQLSDGSMPESIQKIDAHLINAVCDDILETVANVNWDDIAGQQQAKQMIQELVVWPMKNPGLFVGARTPAKGLLLFGPPGTGKTMIGKAIACNINATFFNISASSLTSKWIGESEKLVKALFAVAKATAPSVIFIDEVDSVLTARKSEGEHEASRRLKTELMVQTEGCGLAEGGRILLVGATNRPEELDEAARRRMPKQLYISLPCHAARLSMLQRQFYPQGKVKTDLTREEVNKVVHKTEGYSGADMKNLIQEACQGPVREIIHLRGSDVSGLTEDDLRAVNLRDFKAACKAQKASVHPDEIQRYVEYNSRHGASLMHTADCTQADSSSEEW